MIIRWDTGLPNTIKIIRIKGTFKPFQGEIGISHIQTKSKLREDDAGPPTFMWGLIFLIALE